MNPQELEALRPIINEWLPPFVTAVEPQVRKIAADVVGALSKVQPESRPLSDLEAEHQRQNAESAEAEVAVLTEDIALIERRLTEERSRAEKAVEEAAESERKARRFAAEAEEVTRSLRDDIAELERTRTTLQAEREELEVDRNHLATRQSNLEAVLTRLLTNARLVAQRRSIPDWEKTLSEADYVLSGGSVLT